METLECVIGKEETEYFVSLTNYENPLAEQIKSLPGFKWNSDKRRYIFPAHRRAALALRKTLTSNKDAKYVISGSIAEELKKLADTPEFDGKIETKEDGNKVIAIRTPHSNPLRDDLKKVNASWVNDRWEVELENAAQLIKLAEKHDLMLPDTVQETVTETHGVFQYDGTVDGLRGVPVSELVTVAKQKARGKQASLEDRLKEIGITSVYDLLMTVPRKYLDRSAMKPISELTVGEEVGFIATVSSVGRYDRQKRIVRHVVKDNTGSVSITFFSAPWQAFRFKEGQKVAVYGKLDVWNGSNRRVLQMVNPIMDPLDDDTALIVPIYPQSGKNSVTTWDLHTAAMEAVKRIGTIADPVPQNLIEENGLLPRTDAYIQVHHPSSVKEAEIARRRLAFDEFLRMQLALLMSKYASDDSDKGIAHQPDYSLTVPYLDRLPYQITNAQRKALTSIKEDLAKQNPMHRLLQGDVGSGKTTTAIVALIMCVESGHQAALMAPTEILSWQLYKETLETTDGLVKGNGEPVKVEYLTGKTKAKDRRRILEELGNGTVDIIVGTHALLTEEVAFHDLGLVIIDEQHRFGVEQRAKLRDKTKGDIVPDMLVMTATPIPRTSAMTVYGDLDITIIDEMPPGRTPVLTEWVNMEPVLDSPLEHPWDKIREQISLGHQAYVVCPLVEESEKLQAASATETFEALRHGALAGLRVGLVHGQMPAVERDETMANFKNGEIDVIVATTVIEVGVNVPNATIIAILDAPRFGLAQLHQLRGRVGRASYESYCYLVGNPNSSDGVERMRAMVRTTSGFELSEVDAKLRGVGSVYGARQAGKQSDLKVGDVQADYDIIIAARTAAAKILENDHALNRQPVLKNEVYSSIDADAAEWLTRS